MDVTNCLAGHNMVSFKNHAIEHPGKSMKPRQISAKFCQVWQDDDRVPISVIATTAVWGGIIPCTYVSGIGTCTIMWNTLKLKIGPKHPFFSTISTVFLWHYGTCIAQCCHEYVPLLVHLVDLPSFCRY